MSKTYKKRLFPKVAFDISVTPLVSSSDVGRAIKFGQSVTFYWTFYWRELRNDANIIRCSHLAPWISCHSGNYFLCFIEKGEVGNGALFTISLWCSSFFHYWQNWKSFGANLSQAFKLWCPMAHSWLPIAPKMPIALKASMHWEKVGGQKAARWKKTLSLSKQERKNLPFPNRKENTFTFQT